MLQLNGSTDDYMVNRQDLQLISGRESDECVPNYCPNLVEKIIISIISNHARYPTEIQAQSRTAWVVVSVRIWAEFRMNIFCISGLLTK